MGRWFLLLMGVVVGGLHVQGAWAQARHTFIWQSNEGAIVSSDMALLPAARGQRWYTYIYVPPDSTDSADPLGAEARHSLRIQAAETPVAVWVDGRLAFSLQPGQVCNLPRSLAEPGNWSRVLLVMASSRGFVSVDASPARAQPAQRAQLRPKPPEPLPRLPVVALLVVPVVLLVGWRVSDSATFDRLFTRYPNYRKLYEDAQQGNLLRGVSQLWALLLRTWLAGGVVAWLFGADRLPLPPLVSGFVDEGFTRMAPVQWVAICAAGIAGLRFVRYAILWWIGYGNGWRIFVRWVNALDTLASLPALAGVYLLIWGLQFPGTHLEDGFRTTVSWVLIGLFVVWHGFILIRGLRVRGLFSWVGLGLYICALEVLPWLLLVPAAARW